MEPFEEKNILDVWEQVKNTEDFKGRKGEHEVLDNERYGAFREVEEFRKG